MSRSYKYRKGAVIHFKEKTANLRKNKHLRLYGELLMCQTGNSTENFIVPGI